MLNGTFSLGAICGNRHPLPRHLGPWGILRGVFPRRARGSRRAPQVWISIAGPGSSFALAGVFWLVVQTLLTRGTVLGELVNYLTLINLLLGAFNLLPCLPLDGGRVLRSLIWRYSSKRARATRVTTGVGQVLAVILIGVGISQIFAVRRLVVWARH